MPFVGHGLEFGVCGTLMEHGRETIFESLDGGELSREKTDKKVLLKMRITLKPVKSQPVMYAEIFRFEEGKEKRVLEKLICFTPETDGTFNFKIYTSTFTEPAKGVVHSYYFRFYAKSEIKKPELFYDGFELMRRAEFEELQVNLNEQ